MKRTRVEESVGVSGLLQQAEGMLIDGGLPPDLAAAIMTMARRGAEIAGSSAPRKQPPDHVSQLEHLWRVRELAHALDVHERTVMRHIETGRLRSSRIGRQHRIRQSDVDAFLAQSMFSHEEHRAQRVVDSGPADATGGAA